MPTTFVIVLNRLCLKFKTTGILSRHFLNPELQYNMQWVWENRCDNSKSHHVPSWFYCRNIPILFENSLCRVLLPQGCRLLSVFYHFYSRGAGCSQEISRLDFHGARHSTDLTDFSLRFYLCHVRAIHAPVKNVRGYLVSCFFCFFLPH